MANTDYRGVDQVSDPSVAPFAVTPHDTNALPRVTKALYVGGAGNLLVRCPGNSADVLFVSVPLGTILPVRASHVRAMGTTASNIVGL